MSSGYEWCEKCRAYVWVATHTCKRFHVRIEQYDYDTDVYASDHAEAAERSCSMFDDGDYCIIGNGGDVCIVTSAESGKKWRVEIEAEAVPTYNAGTVTELPYDPNDVEGAEDKAQEEGK